jgi:hypothetical protein
MYDKQSLHLQAQVFSELIWQNYVVCEKAELFTIESDNLFLLPILKQNNKFQNQKFLIPFLCKMLFIHFIIWCFSFMWKGKQKIVGSWIFLFCFYVVNINDDTWLLLVWWIKMLDCTPMWPFWTNKYMQFLICRLRKFNSFFVARILSNCHVADLGFKTLMFLSWFTIIG